METNETTTTEYCQQKLRAYERAATVAPALSNTAHRILTELIRQAAPPHWHTAASQTELTATTRCSERATCTALAQLAALHYIDCTRGTQHHRSVYTLLPAITAAADTGQTVAEFRAANFAPLGGSGRTLRPATIAALAPNPKSRAANNAPLSVPDHTARPANTDTAEPPHIRNARAHVDIDSIRFDKDRSRQIAERIIEAKPTDFATADLDTIAEHIAAYQETWGRHPIPRPPDTEICAQTLAAAGSMKKFHETMGSLKLNHTRAGDTWAWYVAVMAQRCSGITKKQMQEAREDLRASRQRPARAATAYDLPDVAAIAKLKRMTS